MGLPVLTHPEFNESKLKSKSVSLIAFCDNIRKRKDKTCSIRLRLIHNRFPKYYTTSIYMTEKDYVKMCGPRPRTELKEDKGVVFELLKKAHDVIVNLPEFSFKQFDEIFLVKKPKNNQNVFHWYDEKIALLKAEGKLSSLDIPIKNTMAVNLALNYKWVGAAMNDSTDLGAVQLGYANLDVTFNYIYETTFAVRPFIEGGGYGAYLVNAQKVFAPDGQDPYTESVNIGNSSTDDITAWDIGLTIGGGVYLNNWKFAVGYSESIIDLSPDTEWILRNKMGYAKVTYFFGKKKNK